MVCPLMALLRSADRARKCLLSGVDRTIADITKPTRLTRSRHGGTAYSMTSSARARIDAGMERPSGFAVLLLITSSNRPSVEAPARGSRFPRQYPCRRQMAVYPPSGQELSAL